MLSVRAIINFNINNAGISIDFSEIHITFLYDIHGTCDVLSISTVPMYSTEKHSNLHVLF